VRMSTAIENEAFRPGYRVFQNDLVISSPKGVELARIAGEKVFRFGKWEGCRIGFVWEKEPDYLKWLSSQPWFLEKHKQLVTAIKSIDDFDAVVAGAELGWEDGLAVAEDERHARARREKRLERASRTLSQPKSPRAPRASREVTVLPGGCRLIRPVAWSRGR
jgi:hypothetical protein